jgi:hypothetical protein
MKDRILNGLQGEGADALVTLAIDHLLAMNASEFVDPASLASTAVATFRHSAQSGQADAWIRSQIDAATSAAPSGSLRDHLPNEITRSLRDTIALPVTPNRAMVGRLIEHGAVESLLRNLLVSALQGFAKRLRPSVPGAEKATTRLRSLKRVGEGMLGGLGAELERQAEQKAKDFVDSILSSVIAQAADDLCDPAKAETYGRFRGHILDQLLDTPLEDWRNEIEKLDTELLISTANASARALADRPNLEQEVQEVIEHALKSMGDQSLGAILQDADVSDDWRTEAETRASSIVRSIASSEAFDGWLDALLSD